MRSRHIAALALAGLFQVMTPAPVAAQRVDWWGWLDHLSGPGPFKGTVLDFRLVCFGPESPAKRLAARLTEARQLTTAVVPGDDNGPFARAKAAWDELLAELARTAVTFPVLPLGDVADARGRLLALTKNDLLLFNARSGESASQARDASPNARVDDLGQTIRWVKRVAAANIAAGSTGVFWSACSNDKTRRSSLDLGVSFWETKDTDEQYANGQPIRLTTVMASYSWRLFDDPRYDFLDAGFGGGAYFFTSQGFDSFSGVVVQPFRLDLHAPSLWNSYSLGDGALRTAARVAALVTFRYGAVTFPSGFEADAFAAAGDKARRIHAELNRTWSVLFNLKPLLQHTKP